MPLKKIRLKRPVRKSPKRLKRKAVRKVEFTPFQKQCRDLLDMLSAEWLPGDSDIPVEFWHMFCEVMDDFSLADPYEIATSLLTTFDAKVDCRAHHVEPSYSVGGEYKNYSGYKLPWTEQTGERPSAYCTSDCFWTAVLTVYLTLCLRTDQNLWLTKRKLLPSGTPTAKAGTPA